MSSLETVALEIAREQADTPDAAEEAFDLFAIMQFIQDLLAQCDNLSRRRRFSGRRALRRAQRPSDAEIARAVETAQRHGFAGREAHGLVQTAIKVFANVQRADVDEWVLDRRRAMVL